MLMKGVNCLLTGVVPTVLASSAGLRINTDFPARTLCPSRPTTRLSIEASSGLPAAKLPDVTTFQRLTAANPKPNLRRQLRPLVSTRPQADCWLSGGGIWAPADLCLRRISQPSSGPVLVCLLEFHTSPPGRFRQGRTVAHRVLAKPGATSCQADLAMKLK